MARWSTEGVRFELPIGGVGDMTFVILGRVRSVNELCRLLEVVDVKPTGKPAGRVNTGGD